MQTPSNSFPVFAAVACLFAALPAQADDIMISVTITAGANGSVAPEGTQEVPAGTVIDPIVATPNLGYKVEDWFFNGNAMGWDVSSITLATGDYPVAVHVRFVRITNLVHITAAGGGTVQPDTEVSVPWGGGISFTASPEDGHHVDTWTVDDTVVQVGGNEFRLSGVTSEHWLRVDFATDTYSILGKATPHGTIEPTGAVSVARGDNQSFSGSPDEGYTLSGWMLDGGIVQAEPGDYTLVNVQANHTVKALFGRPVLDCQPVIERLASANEADVWWFTANAGDRTEFRLSRAQGEGESSPFVPTMSLYGPDGKLIATMASGSPNLLTLTNSGTHLLLVHDQEYETNGNYVLKVGSPSCPGPPRLSIAQEGGLVTVSWPAPADGWVLERTGSLQAGQSFWQEVPPPYESDGGRLKSIFTIGPMPSQFYRLRRP